MPTVILALASVAAACIRYPQATTTVLINGFYPEYGPLISVKTHYKRVVSTHNIYTIICLKSVVVRKLQVAILARSPREMSQTDRIVWKHILSRVRVSVKPRICFICGKKPIVNTVARMLFISMDHRPAIVSPASKAVGPTMTDWLGAPIQRRSWVGMGCACSRVWACVHACAMCLQYTIIIFYPGW